MAFGSRRRPQQALHSHLPLLLAWFCLCGIVLAQGIYATELNRLFYTHMGPFYDSAYYLDGAARVMEASRSEGLLAGLKIAVAPSNGMLVYLEAALLGVFIAPSRALFVWLQELWMLALACSICWYLIKLRGLHPVVAVVCSVPFLSFATVYWHTGGLSDLRLDLSLYMFLSLTAIWYLATFEVRARWPWLLATLFLVLTVVCRAIGAAYALFMFGPLLVYQIWSASPDERRRILGILLWFGLPAALIIGVYYFSRLDYLYRYYFEWGTQSTKNLPVGVAIRHFLVALEPFGSGLKLALAVSLGLQVVLMLRRPDWRGRLASFNWKVLWLALAPGVLLTARGVGFHIMITYPMVFGITLFCLTPFLGRHPFRRMTAPAAVVCSLLAGASLVNAALGVARHRYEPTRGGEMSAFRQVEHLIVTDSRRRGRNEASVVATSAHLFATVFLRNTLVYESGGRPRRGGIELPDGFVIRTPYESQFITVTKLDWREHVPGKSDDQKYAHLVSLAERELDYILLPDEPSLEFLETKLSYAYQNLLVRELRRRLLATKNWAPVGEPIVVSPGEETLVLYRNATK